MKILVHSGASANDSHLKEEIPAAIRLAEAAGIRVEVVGRLSDAKERLTLPARNPSSVSALLSADNTAKIYAAVVRHLQPLTIREDDGLRESTLKAPLAAIMPTAKSNYPFVLSDAGAHTENSPMGIAVGALLCGAFWRVARGGRYPRYGVFGYGEEESKLPTDMRMAYNMLRSYKHRSVKIVEPKEILAGDAAEVLVVRNGEIGNVILKTAEATISAFGTIVREEIRAQTLTLLGGALVRPAFDRVKDRLYHGDAHGALFLGPTKPVMKHHGRMGAEDLFLAIQRLATYVKDDVSGHTRSTFLAQIKTEHPGWLVE